MKDKIIQICDEIKAMLIEKNEAYGNSAADPVRIFSKADPVEQIRVRIDDKLSRIMKGKDYPGEDTIDDLIGYLVLYKALGRKDEKEANLPPVLQHPWRDNQLIDKLMFPGYKAGDTDFSGPCTI